MPEPWVYYDRYVICLFEVKNYCLRCLLLGGLTIFSLQVCAQGQEKYLAEKFAQNVEWAAATLVSGDTVQGAATLYWSEDILVMKADNRVLPAVQVQSFVVEQHDPPDFDRRKRYDFELMRQGYFPGNSRFTQVPALQKPRDAERGVSRVFHTCRWSNRPNSAGFRALGYFEQLSAGPVVLLSRLALQRQTHYTYPVGSYTQFVKYDGFYLIRPDGSLLFLQNLEKDFYACFPAAKPQVQAFARRYHLDFSRPEELAYLVNYANSLAVPAQP